MWDIKYTSSCPFLTYKAYYYANDNKIIINRLIIEEEVDENNIYKMEEEEVLLSHTERYVKTVHISQMRGVTPHSFYSLVHRMKFVAK